MAVIKPQTEEDLKAALYPEDEWHDFVILGITEEEGRYGPTLRWIFQDPDRVDNDGKPFTKWGWTGVKPGHPNAALTKYLKWLKVDVPADGLDTDTLIGQPVQIMFEHVQKLNDDGLSVWREQILKMKPGGAATVSDDQAPF